MSRAETASPKGTKSTSTMRPPLPMSPNPTDSSVAPGYCKKSYDDVPMPTTTHLPETSTSQ